MKTTTAGPEEFVPLADRITEAKEELLARLQDQMRLVVELEHEERQYDAALVRRNKADENCRAAEEAVASVSFRLGKYLKEQAEVNFANEFEPFLELTATTGEEEC